MCHSGAPQRSEASPESITPVSGYGFRALDPRPIGRWSRPGMTRKALRADMLVGSEARASLVIDTVAVKSDRPLAMLDFYSTPYTRALHVVERYRLLDYEAAREGLERDAKESPVIPNTTMQRDPAYRGKYLQLLVYGGRSRCLHYALVRNDNL